MQQHAEVQVKASQVPVRCPQVFSCMLIHSIGIIFGIRTPPFLLRDVDARYVLIIFFKNQNDILSMDFKKEILYKPLVQGYLIEIFFLIQLNPVFL